MPKYPAAQKDPPHEPVRRGRGLCPQVSQVEASVDGDQLYVRWVTEAADDAVRVDRFVRWSSDEGRTWSVLAVGLDDDGFVGSVESMPAGPALVQVVVTDGFHTNVGEWVQVEVPWTPPSLAILWPRRDAPVEGGVPLRLWGVATASDGRRLRSAQTPSGSASTRDSAGNHHHWGLRWLR